MLSKGSNLSVMLASGPSASDRPDAAVKKSTDGLRLQFFYLGIVADRSSKVIRRTRTKATRPWMVGNRFEQRLLKAWRISVLIVPNQKVQALNEENDCAKSVYNLFAPHCTNSHVYQLKNQFQNLQICIAKSKEFYALNLHIETSTCTFLIKIWRTSSKDLSA